eukprot:221490_1
MFRPIGNRALQCNRQIALNTIPISSSIHWIHTQKQQMKSNKPRKTASHKTSSSRWFTAISMPSMPFINLPQLTQSIGVLTGNQAMSTKHDRIMNRVWEKRKKKLYKSTSETLSHFEAQNMKFDTAQLYIRASGSFDDSEDNAQKEVHIALRGIAHTVVVLQSGPVSYLLDRVVEGIRLTELEINPETQTIMKCNKFKPDEMVKLGTFNDLNLYSSAIADWITQESQTEYNMITNNCVWFSFYFWQHFLLGLKTQQRFHSMKRKVFV